MKYKRANREDIYISPVLLVDLFNGTRKEVGQEVFTSRKYKVLREAWIASMFSVALSSYQGGVWWLRPNKEDTAPDFYAFNTKRAENGEYMEAVNTGFEVFEWGKMSQDSLLEAILKKIHNWRANKISVICYASKENQLLNFLNIYKELKNTKTGVLEIWILAKIKEADAYFAVQVYPHFLPLPVPSKVPSYFKEPFSFVSKHRGKTTRNGGKVELNSEMEIVVYPEE